MQMQVDELGHRLSSIYVGVILTGKPLAQAGSYPQSGIMLNSGRDLLPFTRARHAEIDTALVVRLGRSRQVEIRQRNLLRMLRSEDPQSLAYDGVILHFLFVLIAENQHRGLRRLCGFFFTFAGLRRRRVRIHILIALLAHPLFVQALRVHLVRQTNLAFPVLVVGRTGIPPPVRIDSAAEIRVRVAPTPPAPNAIIPEAAASESPITMPTAEAVEIP